MLKLLKYQPLTPKIRQECEESQNVIEYRDGNINVEVVVKIG